VGFSCCSTLKQAKDVEVGETVWEAAQADGEQGATASTVVSKGTAHSAGKQPLRLAPRFVPHAPHAHASSCAHK
jgi:hypothetical protein